MECDPRVPGAKPDLCRQLDIRGYPTWIVGGQRLEGARPLSELARVSGFPG